jgi:chromosome segregation ATPase
MQNNRPARLGDQSAKHERDLPALQPAPSFSLAEANTLLDIEVQADQLLAYIDKLTTLADRACSSVIRQNETSRLVEENRRNEINHLRRQLDSQNAQLREQQLALIRVENESRAKIATLEARLQQSPLQPSSQAELESLRAENADRAEAARMGIQQELAPLKQEVAELRLELAKRDETIQNKTAAIRNNELEFRAKILALEQKLREAQAQLTQQEAKLQEKEALVQATAAKEAEMGNLIKRLSAECANLSKELHEKSCRLAEIESKQAQPIAPPKLWRQVIGRLQEDPQ